MLNDGVTDKEIKELGFQEDEIEEIKTLPPPWWTDDTPVTKVQQDEFEAYLDSCIQQECAQRGPSVYDTPADRRYAWIRRHHAPIGWVNEYLIPSVVEKVVARFNKDESDREVFSDGEFGLDWPKKILKYVVWAPSGYVRIELDWSMRQVVSTEWLLKPVK